MNSDLLPLAAFVTCILPFLVSKVLVSTHLTFEKHNHSYIVTILRVVYFWGFELAATLFSNIVLFDLALGLSCSNGNI